MQEEETDNRWSVPVHIISFSVEILIAEVFPILKGIPYQKMFKLRD